MFHQLQAQGLQAFDSNKVSSWYLLWLLQSVYGQDWRSSFDLERRHVCGIMVVSAPLRYKTTACSQRNTRFLIRLGGCMRGSKEQMKRGAGPELTKLLS